MSRRSIAQFMLTVVAVMLTGCAAGPAAPAAVEETGGRTGLSTGSGTSRASATPGASESPNADAAEAKTCDKPREPDPAKSNAAAQAVERYTSQAAQASYYPNTSSLTLRSPTRTGEVNPFWLRQMRRALGDTFACTELNVTVYDWAVLPAVESLRVGALALTLPAAEHEAPPGVLTVLTGMPGLTSLATALNVPGDLAPLKSVKTLFADMRFGEGFDLKAWAKTLPNVTELELLYEDKEGAWEPEAVSAFTGVKSVTMGNWNEAGELGSQSVSIEAGEMLVSTAHALPSNVIFNGIRASKVTLDTLGLKDAKTRERIAFEKKATENTTLLTDWWRDTVGSDWGEAAVPSPLVGPIVIVKGTESSAKDGAWGEDHNGVPAVVLCAEVDGCAYVVEFGHRAGAASGRYAPASGGAVVFEGNLGETTVTIYDPEAKSKAVVVVATTRPPDTVHSKSEAIGPADYDAAWRWVKNNVVKNSAASGDSA